MRYVCKCLFHHETWLNVKYEYGGCVHLFSQDTWSLHCRISAPYTSFFRVAPWLYHYFQHYICISIIFVLIQYSLLPVCHYTAQNELHCPLSKHKPGAENNNDTNFKKGKDFYTFFVWLRIIPGELYSSHCPSLSRRALRGSKEWEWRLKSWNNYHHSVTFMLPQQTFTLVSIAPHKGRLVCMRWLHCTPCTIWLLCYLLIS